MQFLSDVVLPADPNAALEAATKQYVDGQGGGTPEIYAQAAAPAGTGADVFWVDVDDLTGTDGGAPHNHDAAYLAPADVIAGTNVTVTDNANGTITVASTGGGGGLDQATADARYVNLTGDTMSGGLVAADLGANTVSAYTAPTNADHVTRKDYVDARPADVGTAVWSWLEGAGAPGVGQISYDGAVLRVNNLDANGMNRVPEVSSWAVGDHVYLRNKSGESYDLLVTSNTDNTSYRTIAMTIVSGGGSYTTGVRAYMGVVPKYAPKTTVSSTAPSSPATGDLWVDTT